GTSLLFPVRTVDAVELEPNVVKASTFFHHINHSPEKDPRVHIQFNDGRNYLLASDKKYDIVMSEPSNPWQAGVCNLFTREYFEICRQRLKPGGLYALWMQTAEVPPQDVAGVLAGVNATFPYAIVFAPNASNIIVVASMDPISIDFARVKKLFEDR